MEHCVPLATHPRRDIILHAIEEHDNGWAEEDEAPRVDTSTGEVIDFVNANAAMRQAVWSRGVARLASDPWASALVAQHAIVIYDRHKIDTPWAAFFDEMRDARDQMVRASGGRLEELLADYAFVRLADLISLTFCTGWTDEQRTAAWRIQLSGSRVSVTPDPFGGVEIPVAVTARELLNQRFRDDAGLRDTLGEATEITLTGTVVGAVS